MDLLRREEGTFQKLRLQVGSGYLLVRKRPLSSSEAFWDSGPSEVQRRQMGRAPLCW